MPRHELHMGRGKFYLARGEGINSCFLPAHLLRSLLPSALIDYLRGAKMSSMGATQESVHTGT